MATATQMNDDKLEGLVYKNIGTESFNGVTHFHFVENYVKMAVQIFLHIIVCRIFLRCQKGR